MNLTSAPESSTDTKTSKTHHGLLLIVAIIVVVAGLGGATWSWAITQGDHIIPHVSILDVAVGGMSSKEATKTIERALDQRWHQGVRVQVNGKTTSLGTATHLVNYHLKEAVSRAVSLGREGSRSKRLLTPLKVALFGDTESTAVSIDKTALEERVTRTLGAEFRERRDAQLIIEASDTTSTIRIEPDQAGKHVNVDDLVQALQTAAAANQDAPIPLKIEEVPAAISSASLTPLIPSVEEWLAHAPFTLNADETTWKVKRSDLAHWIQATTSTQPISLTIDTDALATHLRAHTKELLKPVHDGRIALGEDGKATAFEAPEEGVDVDAAATAKSILAGWQAGSSTIPVALTRVEPKILGDGERLGIHEIIGVGRSNFSGSPSNRRKNIALGAKKVGMTHVPPNEDFSMLKVLGTIDGPNGWLPELVIKGNKTTPEFGGGLCQVGTTMFRAALASGLPITERRNHSYRVRYYEPAGTDATIYDPAPDFKFKNDLTGWILVTTRVQGSDLIFTVWGKKDGRKVEQTASKVFNIVPSPPKKIIETLDLKPGEEKCTETAHAGADAQFDYNVTYPDGTVVKKTFFSRYKPWQAVCLKGVLKLTQPVDGVDETGVNNPNL